MWKWKQVCSVLKYWLAYWLQRITMHTQTQTKQGVVVAGCDLLVGLSSLVACVEQQQQWRHPRLMVVRGQSVSQSVSQSVGQSVSGGAP